MNQLRVWLTAADFTSFVGKTLESESSVCIYKNTKIRYVSNLLPPKKEIITVVLMSSKIFLHFLKQY